MKTFADRAYPLFQVELHVIYNTPLAPLGNVGREWVQEPLVEHLDNVSVKYQSHPYGIVSAVYVDGKRLKTGAHAGQERAVRLHALQEVLRVLSRV